MDINIRPVKEIDYLPLCALIEQGDAYHRTHLPHLFKKSDGPPRERSYFLSLVYDEKVGLFLAQMDGKLAGFVNAKILQAPDYAIIVPRQYVGVDNLVVDKSFRRLGIGRLLMERVHQWAADKGITEIELTVYAFNQGAKALYEALGYETLNFRMSKNLAEDNSG